MKLFHDGNDVGPVNEKLNHFSPDKMLLEKLNHFRIRSVGYVCDKRVNDNNFDEVMRLSSKKNQMSKVEDF